MRLDRFAIAVATTALLMSSAVGEDMQAARRYVAPSGLFSISMDDLVSRRFHAGRESSTNGVALVDFSYLPTVSLALIKQRAVEWFALDKPLDPLQFDRSASDLVDGYLQSRFGAGKFVVADRGKFRDAQGRLTYAFAAKGNAGQMPAVWQGVVLLFDNGAALISEVVAQPSSTHFESQNGVADQAVVDWAATFRAGP